MKKKIVILIIICFIFILIGCNNKNQGEIKFSNLMQKEESLLKLIENEADCKIYDYVLNNNVKSIYVNFKTLNSNGEWQENGGASSDVSSTKGRIAISSFRDEGNLQISIENGDGVVKFKSNSELYDNAKGMTRAMAWDEECDFVCEKEIPLAMQIISNTSEIGISMNNFYNTDELKDYDIVNAVTVTFSENTIN
ncbi:hypothetical protein FDE77_04480 [Clostridium botulinum]|nr:hypothetical protein [Clostridium botulinum]